MKFSFKIQIQSLCDLDKVGFNPISAVSKQLLVEQCFLTYILLDTVCALALVGNSFYTTRFTIHIMFLAPLLGSWCF